MLAGSNMRTKRRKPQRNKKTFEALPAKQDLDAASRALLEEREGPDAAAPRDASIEDPLQDWPESAGEEDQWLKERRGGSDQEREG